MKAKLRQLLTVRNVILFLIVVIAGLFLWRLYLLIFKNQLIFASDRLQWPWKSGQWKSDRSKMLVSFLGA